MSMNKRILTPFVIIILGAALQACTTSGNPQSGNNPTSQAGSKPLTMKVAELDALFSDKVFTAAVKTKLQLSDDQIVSLKKITSAELAKSRSSAPEQTSDTDTASSRAMKSIYD